MVPIILTCVSALLLAPIIYFALAPRSPALLRRAALIALALIGLSLGVSAIILLSGRSSAPAAALPDAPPEQVTPVKQGSMAPVIVVAVVLLLFMALLFFIARRERR
ncbi:MAG: hypothetical protein LBR16_04735 [Treponema sp.]|jgi:hypothetical protein|nr:hypothetical protein [Treponema sp.]